jgi:hypothetical protein
MPATLDKIKEALDSPEFTYGEKFIIRWQFDQDLDLLDEFEKPLIEAIKIADEDNLSRLAAGFPQQIAAFRAWAHGDLAWRLREWGLGI